MFSYDPESIRDPLAIQPEEGELLEALVRSLKPNLCYETGTHFGLSSSYIARGLSRNKSGHLHTADPRDYNQGQNLQSAVDWVTVHLCAGKDVPIVGEIDFLFLDGFHDKVSVMEEFNHFLPSLTKNAIVVFHDCRDIAEDAVADDIPQLGGVNAAVKELGLKTTYLKTFNRMRIYEHSGK